MSLTMRRAAADGDFGRHTYVPEIDGLRAIAVLSVMAYHLQPAWLPGGFVGVDVFFVISGYVVSGSIWRDAARPLPAMLVRFYARRVLRILPALLLCLLVCSLLGVLFVPPSWLGGGIWSTARAAYIGTSNLALLRIDTYFSPQAELNLFTHTWSLGVEEQFYLIYPALLFAWCRMRGRVAGWAGRLLIPAAAIASFIWLARGSPATGFYLLPGRFWELAAGALLFQAQIDGWAPALSRLARTALLAAGFAILGAALCAADPAGFPYPWALLPVIGTMLALAAVTAGGAARERLPMLLHHPALVRVGRLSYELYLWHWGIYVLLRWTWGLSNLVQQAVAVLLTFAMSGLSYRLVERPVRRAAWPRRASPWAVVLVGVSAALLAREATQQMARAQDRITLSVVRQHGALWYSDAVKDVDGPGQCPVVTRDARTGIAWIIELHRVCTPLLPARHRLFILGDSHAVAYSRMASMIARADDILVRIYSASGCPVANLLGGAPPACAAYIDQALADIASRAAPGDFVLLAGLRAIRSSEQWGPYSPEEMAARTEGPAIDAGRREGLVEASRILTVLERIPRIQIVFEAPKPVFAAPVFRCADWFNAGNPACRGGLAISRNAALRARQPVMDEIAVLKAQFPKLTVWDPFDLLCPGATCWAITPDGPLFVDGDHLSAYANTLLYPGFSETLRGSNSEPPPD